MFVALLLVMLHLPIVCIFLLLSLLMLVSHQVALEFLKISNFPSLCVVLLIPVDQQFSYPSIAGNVKKKSFSRFSIKKRNHVNGSVFLKVW